jgi:hypothetical protein
MAPKFKTINRPVDSDFGTPMVNSTVTKLAEKSYKAVTTINGRRLEAFGHSEGMAAEKLSQIVDDLTIKGELSGLIN